MSYKDQNYCCQDTCATDQSHHHQEHTCCCKQHECCCHEEGEMAGHLYKLADEAWMELLKEKIKEKILQHDGAQLDALASAISESNGKRWKSKLCIKNNKENFKAKLDQIFGQDNHSQCTK